MDSLETSSIQTGERRHRILLVEDEAMISKLLEDMVLDCGGEIVGPVARFDHALALAHKAEFGVAVLRQHLQSLHLKVLDNSVSTISQCRVGFITHDTLSDLCTRYPRLAAAFWRETLIDAAIFREWVMNVGRREGSSRMAHVLCELLVRLKAVGLVEDHVCDLPITQSEFADALGFTTVHVNRVLQQLRAEGLIMTQGTTLKVPDWNKLKEAGEFDPTYLHLVREDAAA
jgi:hypothetical protein